jgi:hypothetical protein
MKTSFLKFGFFWHKTDLKLILHTHRQELPLLALTIPVSSRSIVSIGNVPNNEENPSKFLNTQYSGSRTAASRHSGSKTAAT